MTRYGILKFADDTTDTHCGSCDHKGISYNPYGADEYDCGFGRLGPSHLPAQRHRDCLDAELEAAQLVAIAPEDARIWSAPVEALAFTDDTEVAAALRINEALRIHGRKA